MRGDEIPQALRTALDTLNAIEPFWEDDAETVFRIAEAIDPIDRHSPFDSERLDKLRRAIQLVEDLLRLTDEP